MKRVEITNRIHGVCELKSAEKDYQAEVEGRDLKKFLSDLHKERLLPIRDSEISTLLLDIQKDLEVLEQLLYRFLFESLVLYFKNLRKADCSKKHIETALKVLGFLSDKFEADLVASREKLSEKGLVMTFDFWNEVLVGLIEDDSEFRFESLAGVMSENELCEQWVASRIRLFELKYESKKNKSEIERVQSVTRGFAAFLTEHYGDNNLNK